MQFEHIHAPPMHVIRSRMYDRPHDEQYSCSGPSTCAAHDAHAIFPLAARRTLDHGTRPPHIWHVSIEDDCPP
jgi:hypothetical protein